LSVEAVERLRETQSGKLKADTERVETLSVEAVEK
jgi:hypothetical protein